MASAKRVLSFSARAAILAPECAKTSSEGSVPAGISLSKVGYSAFYRWFCPWTTNLDSIGKEKSIVTRIGKRFRKKRRFLRRFQTKNMRFTRISGHSREHFRTHIWYFRSRRWTLSHRRTNNHSKSNNTKDTSKRDPISKAESREHCQRRTSWNQEVRLVFWKRRSRLRKDKKRGSIMRTCKTRKNIKISWKLCSLLTRHPIYSVLWHK